MTRARVTVRFHINGEWVHYDAALIRTLRLEAVGPTEQCDGCGADEWEAKTPVRIACTSCGTTYHAEDE